MKKEKDTININSNMYTILSMVRTFDVLMRYLELEMGRHGTNPIRYSIMYTLMAHGGTMPPSALSKTMFRAKHTITSMVRILERRKYVVREPSTKDHRSVNIVVTKKGWETTKKVEPVADQINKNILNCFDEQQIESLMVLLNKMKYHLLDLIDDLNKSK